MKKKKIETVLKEHSDSLMLLPGVIGTAQAQCDGNPCIKVYVIKKTFMLDTNVPSTIEGYPVFVQETKENIIPREIAYVPLHKQRKQQ